jgi:hypothetical protein
LTRPVLALAVIDGMVVVTTIASQAKAAAADAYVIPTCTGLIIGHDAKRWRTVARRHGPRTSGERMKGGFRS